MNLELRDTRTPPRRPCLNDLGSDTLTERDFRRLSEFIRGRFGINIKPAKKVMLETRLRKRLRSLGMETFREYCDFVFSSTGIATELMPMIDVVTTNKTDFFREPVHFDYLKETVLPALTASCGAGTSRTCMVWSAGCSTGEEPYTLSMVLSEFSITHTGYRFQILATDVSTTVLEKGRRAIYDKIGADPIPSAYRKKYLMWSKDRKRGLVRVVPELRSRVVFRRVNFFDRDLGVDDSFDVIFCRNVAIYFDRPTQKVLLDRLFLHLRPGGYAFMGHSETLHGMDIPLVQVAPSVYRREP